ncbi:MAG: sigma-54 dependent transcriptional regulator [Desulfovibrio sp.]|jgi:two-component system NtrC family response regulator|nr:sigma-54 dependent transcriptional regulator [Desulfovibrio sp.]
MKSVLVIDDEPGLRLMVRAVLEDEGWTVFEAASGEEGLALFSTDRNFARVALVDMNMPGMDGNSTLTRLHEIRPGLPVVMLTAYGTIGSAVEAMKGGAFDYLTKPADNDELVLTLNRAFEYSRLQEENSLLRLELSGGDPLNNLVGTGPAMRAVHAFIRQAGPSEATVLISGESGTGKELIAESLHACSNRSAKPLIKVNCAALPSQLLESELFGYVRGAFTGAFKDKPGRFQLASGGTIFLDEIGEVPLDLQAKLLRVIQDRTLEPLGSVRPVQVDVRIIAATNRNLRQAATEGKFREDLFFRLNVLEIKAPALRERQEDIPLLVSRLVDKLSVKNHKSVRGVTPGFLRALCVYSWPGNVRELENVLERALILSRSDMPDTDSLPPYIADPEAFRTYKAGAVPPGQAPSPDASGEETERAALIQALRLHGGHREKTAAALGISRRTLQYKLRKLGLTARAAGFAQGGRHDG